MTNQISFKVNAGVVRQSPNRNIFVGRSSANVYRFDIIRKIIPSSSGAILTEDGDTLVTEDGDRLNTESE